MSLLDPILRGSLLSNERLLQAREFYAPTRTPVGSPVAFAKWSERVAVQTELGGSRELSGLPDDELAALEAEFVRCPTRPGSEWVRYAVPVGIVLALAGALGVAWAPPEPHGTYSIAQALSVAGLLIGVLAAATGLMASFSTMHLDLSYGTTGLYVGRLDEQHPWLY